MKKLILTLSILIFLTAIILTSCNKYPDGPKISFRSKKARLSGEWTLSSLSINNIDSTSAFLAKNGANFMLEIEKDGSYKTAGTYPDTGTWELGEDKDDVTLTSANSLVKDRTYRITKLENKDLWVYQTQTNGDKWSFQFKQ